MAENNKNDNNTPTRIAHKWSELDFSRVAAAELPDILNMLNQRLAVIEDNTYTRDESGKILADEKGNPLTLTNFYILKAEKGRAAAATAATAQAKKKEDK